MRKNALLFIAITLGCLFTCKAQQADTVKVMYYNILKWEDATDYNNFQTILQFYQPDIIALTEVQTHTIARNIFDCVRNSISCCNYDTTDFYSISWANKGNMLYFNKDKLVMKFQDTIHPAGSRYIDRYLLFYTDVASDTVFLDFYIAHLTPSFGVPNETSRYKETKSFKNYLSGKTYCKNIIFGGDLNLYTGNEAAYRLLLDSGSCRMNDPVNLRGDWSDDAIFSSVHTQSTRSSSGGLDDRFDFMVASDDVISGVNKVKYMTGTYMALGNDGAHLNQDITALPVSTTVPVAVTNALHDKSDHLPVVLKLLVDHPYPPADEGEIEVLFKNPVDDNMDITARIHSKTRLTIKVFNILGQSVYSKEIENAEIYTQCSIGTAGLAHGIYFLRVTDSDNNRFVKKFFKP
jgi:endonuclease/exonuclease/phosphatase family metal-dependent hydrolase